MKFIKKFKINESNNDLVLDKLRKVNEDYHINKISELKSEFEEVIQSDENFYNISIKIMALKDKCDQYINNLISSKNVAEEHLNDISDNEIIYEELQEEIDKTSILLDQFKDFSNLLHRTKRFYGDLFEEIRYILNFKTTY
jgi:hypothetical protein